MLTKLTCRMVHVIESLFLLKACCRICHRDKVKLLQVRLCFTFALLLLVSAIAFLTGGVHLLFTK